VAIQGNKRWLLGGIAIGLWGYSFARDTLNPFRSVLRPLVKAGLRSGIDAFERGQERAARVQEYLDDLVAEVAAERERERQDVAADELEAVREA
jgi:Protein of unknown function (DUF5132)